MLERGRKAGTGPEDCGQGQDASLTNTIQGREQILSLLKHLKSIVLILK